SPCTSRTWTTVRLWTDRTWTRTEAASSSIAEGFLIKEGANGTLVRAFFCPDDALRSVAVCNVAARVGVPVWLSFCHLPARLTGPAAASFLPALHRLETFS